MRKITFLFLALQVFTFLSMAQTVDRKYDFPIKPGSETWKAFTTHQQMVEATALPAKITASLTTKALVETCLDYPLLGDMMLHNSPQKGFDAMAANFNGIQALMQRKEAIRFIATAYQNLLTIDVKKMPSLEQKGKHIFQLSFIETLLSQKAVLATAGAKEIADIRTFIALARQVKAANQDVFGPTSYAYTALLAGNLFQTFYGTKFSVTATDFLKTGLLTDTAILEEIDNATR